MVLCVVYGSQPIHLVSRAENGSNCLLTVEFGQGTDLYDQLFNNQVKLKYKFNYSTS